MFSTNNITAEPVDNAKTSTDLRLSIFEIFIKAEKRKPSSKNAKVKIVAPRRAVAVLENFTRTSMLRCLP